MITETELIHSTSISLKLPYTMKIERHCVARLIVSLEDLELSSGIERIGKFSHGYHFNQIVLPIEIQGSEKEEQLLERIHGSIAVGAKRICKIIYI